MGFLQILLLAVLSTSVESEIWRSGTALCKVDYNDLVLQKIMDLANQMTEIRRRLDNLDQKGTARTTVCKDGWLAFNGSCYAFGPHSVDFKSAKDYCEIQNAHLVYVDTARENAFLKTFMDQHLDEDADYWLGMNDDVIEGTWKYTDTETAVTFLDWGGTEPQNAGSGEDCAAFGHLMQYKWIDVSCNTKRRPLCEKR